MLFRQVSAGFGARRSYAVEPLDTYRFPVIRGTGAGRMRDEDPALMPKPSMLRLVDIAELLGATKQRAHQIAEEKGFPAPLAEDARGRVWSRYQVQAWAKRWRGEKPWR
jgi:hypothetical protein